MAAYFLVRATALVGKKSGKKELFREIFESSKKMKLFVTISVNEATPRERDRENTSRDYVTARNNPAACTHAI